MGLWDRFKNWILGRPAPKPPRRRPQSRPLPRIPPPFVPPVPQTPELPEIAGGTKWTPFDDWNTTRQDIWLSMENENVLADAMAQSLFETGYLDRSVGESWRRKARDSLDEYLFREYGIIFRDKFDWDRWREEYADLDI